MKCKCGRHTQNGFLCTNCQRDGTIDTSYYDPDIDEELEEELEDAGFSIVDGLYEDND